MGTRNERRSERAPPPPLLLPLPLLLLPLPPPPLLPPLPPSAPSLAAAAREAGAVVCAAAVSGWLRMKVLSSVLCPPRRDALLRGQAGGGAAGRCTPRTRSARGRWSEPSISRISHLVRVRGRDKLRGRGGIKAKG